MMRNYNKYKKFKNNKKSFNPYIICAIVMIVMIGMAVGYASFTDTLTITGTANARYTNYYINYELDSGTNPANPVNTFTIADDILLPIPTKNNCNFDGWYLYSDFSGTAVVTTSDIDVLTLNPANNTVTLYAKWNASGNVGTWDNPIIDTTTNTYNPANIPEGATLYSNVPGAPKVEADGNGKITRLEYTNLGSNGMAVPSGGIDTGILAFDGDDFVISIKARLTYGSSADMPILNMSMYNTANGKVDGIMLDQSSYRTSAKFVHPDTYNVQQPSTKGGAYLNIFRFKHYVNDVVQGNKNFTHKDHLTGSSSYSGADWWPAFKEGSVTVGFKVYCTNKIISGEMYNVNDELIAKPVNNKTYDFTSANLDTVTIEVGRFVNTSGTTITSNFNILEFSVRKF